jgi:hypothetical protein
MAKKVYIAARYTRKEEMKDVRDRLEFNGIEVTSSWLDEPHSANTQLNELPDNHNAHYAIADLVDIVRADEIIFFSESELTPRGGRHVEFGYALATAKEVTVIGPRENIFHYLGRVKVYETLDQYLEDDNNGNNAR